MTIYETAFNSITSFSTFGKTLNTIAIFSDLHFDYSNRKYKPTKANENESDFIRILNEEYKESLVLLAGDFYDDYRKTFAFVDRLEREQIYGFFVLGNHDYWNKGKFSYHEMIDLYKSHTENNCYFKLLVSGVPYKINDILFIGDTGWTSFDNGKGLIDLSKKFIDLPEENQIKDFTYSQVLDNHCKWIDYANSILESSSRVIVLTHFPMFGISLKKKSDLWWSSKTRILETKNCWKIHGHTHKNYQEYNCLSYQRGYEDQLDKLYFFNEMTSYDYFQCSIGKLIKLSDSKELVDSKKYLMGKYYNSQQLSSTNEVEIINVKKRGYIRSAANKNVFVELSANPKRFINKVESVLKGYLNNVYIGYTPYKGLTSDEITSIENSLFILKKSDFSDIREYMTAAVIAGYVWNGMPDGISYMRPLDDYDIIRFYLMFLTIKKFGLTMSDVNSVRKNPKHSIKVGNVDVYIPMVNNYTLDPEEVQIELRRTMLLS